MNGCFWHGHEDCKYFVVPKTRTEWWLDKINSTKTRDLQKYCQLKEAGWRVYVLWECDLKMNFESAMDILEKNIRSFCPN